MARYRLTFKKSVAKDLRRIPKRDVGRLLARIELLADQPRGEGCLKLNGRDYYRVRVGIYRIVYEAMNDRLVVQVVEVASQGEVIDAWSRNGRQGRSRRRDLGSWRHAAVDKAK